MRMRGITRRFSCDQTDPSRCCGRPGWFSACFPTPVYTAGEVDLQSGDRLVLYTDGITEVGNGQEEEFGEERLAAVLVRNRHLGAAALHATLMEDVTRFATTGFQDDATLLVVAIH